MNARRAVLGLCGAVAVALAAPALARAQAIAAGLGGNPSALVGDSLDVPVVVDMTARSDRVGSFALRIAWNPAVLQFQAGLSGNFGAVTANVADSAPYGVIRLTGANPAGVGGLVTLGIGRFIVLAADTTTLSLTFSELYAAGTFADLRPSLSVGSGQFCVAQGRYGDVNHDGAVNSGDALVALSAAVGLDVGSYDVALGDVSGDGKTDTRDALVMLSVAVGIDVSAFPRLGQILGGACATGTTVTLALTPAAATGVLVGQEVTFEARATGPTGALMPIPNVAFRSSDTTVLAFAGGVDPATAVARATGSVTVTAVRDARDSAQASVTVVARRGTHWVDAKATTATNQLGTQALPFASIAAAIAVARGGDTIRPQPGRYPEALQLDSALVLMGDTLPDGARPTLTGTGTGISMWTQVPQEIHNLALDGFDTGVDIEGPGQVLLQGLVATNVGYGVSNDANMSALRIVASRFEGRGADSYTGEGVELYGYVDTLVIRGTEIGDFSYGGLYVSGADSVAISGSRLHDIGSYAVAVSGGEGTVGFSLDSTVTAAVYGTLTLQQVRSAVLRHNSLSSSGGEGGNGVYVAGTGHGFARIVGDSSDQPGYYWLYAQALDSLVVDSVHMGLPSGSGWLGDVGLARITNTSFVNVVGVPLYVSYYTLAGGRLALDNVRVTGDPRCDMCAAAIMVSGAATVVNRLTAVNLAEGLWVNGDSGLTVTNSSFSHVGAAISWIVADSGAPARLAVSHSTFTGIGGSGVMASGGAAVTVDSNTFAGSPAPAVMVAGPEGPVQVVGNSFAGVYGAVNLSPTHTVAATISGNTATDVGYGIIGGGAADTANIEYRIVGNEVACSAAGGTTGYGIEVEGSHSVIQANRVLGCWAGITALASGGGTAPVRKDSIVGNSVALPADPYAGIYIEGPVQVAVVGDTVVADTAGSTTYGSIYITGDSTSAGLVTARVDSNVVSGGRVYGVYVTDVDSVAIRYNSVERIANAGYAGSYAYGGGVVIESPVRAAGRIYGNLVRRIGGVGIMAGNQDTAFIAVDSNLVSATPAESPWEPTGIMIGVYPQGGPMELRKNRVTNITGTYSYTNGIFIYWADPARTLIDSNYVAGNTYGMYASNSGTYNAQANWWGDAAGPTCDECTGPGDKVGSFIDYSNWLTSPPPSGLPLTAPIGHVALRAFPGSVAAARTVPLAAAPAGGVATAGRMALRGAPPAARPSPPAPARPRAAGQRGGRPAGCDGGGAGPRAGGRGADARSAGAPVDGQGPGPDPRRRGARLHARRADGAAGGGTAGPRGAGRGTREAAVRRARGFAALLFAAALWLGAPARALAVTDSVLVQVGGDLTGRAGQYVTVPVTVDLSGAPGRLLGSYRARLAWNPAILTYMQVENGNFAAPQVTLDSAGEGSVQATATLPSGAGGAVTIFMARFYVVSDSAQSAVTITFDTMTAAAASATPFENLVPLLAYQQGTFCRSMGAWGDVSGDAEVNSLDALMTLSVVVGIPLGGQTVNAALADVDADGRTTSRDALIMLSYAVGLPVTGFRVLLPAAGACGTGAATTLAVVPDSIELQAGQVVAVLVRAADSSGRVVPADSVTWVSSNPAIASFDAASGAIVARSAGLATLTAQLGPGVQGKLKVSVLARRGTWYADIQRAANAPVQVGSQVLPFQYIGDALAAAQDGDTVLVAAGTYAEIVSQAVSVALLGDSVNRPVIDPRAAPNWDPSFAAVNLGSGAAVAIMANLDVPAGGVVLSAHDVTVRNVTIAGLGGTSTGAGLDLSGTHYTSPSPAPRGGSRPAASASLQAGNVLVSNVVVSGDALPYGIVVEQADTARILNSRVSRAAAGTDVQCGWGPWAPTGIMVRQASVSVVRGNAVVNPECQGIGAYDYSEEMVFDDVGRATISRNQVTGAPGTGIGAGARLVALDHNAVRNTADVPGQQSYGYASAIHVGTVYTAVNPNLAPDSVTSLADTIVRSLSTGIEVDTARWAGVDSLVARDTWMDSSWSYYGATVDLRAGGTFSLSHSLIVNTGTQDGVAVCLGARAFRSHGNRIVNAGSDGMAIGQCTETSSQVDSVFSSADTVLAASESGLLFEYTPRVDVDSAVVDSVGFNYGRGNGIEADYLPWIRVRHSSVRRAWGAGIYAYQVPHMEFLQNRLTANDSSSLSAWYATDSVRIYGLVSDSTGFGVLLGDGAHATVDSSRFTNSDSAGIAFWMATGGLVTRSTFAGNAGYGVQRGGNGCCSTDLVVVRQSTFQGNLLGGAANLDTEMSVYLDADSNYWGDPNGPRCQFNVIGCDSASVAGDWIATSDVTFADWLGSPPLTPAAPARPAVLMAARAPGLRSGVSGARPAIRAPAAPRSRSQVAPPLRQASRAGAQAHPTSARAAPWHAATGRQGIRVELRRKS